jgi:hypothetical protein
VASFAPCSVIGQRKLRTLNSSSASRRPRRALDALRLQYPEYAEALERRFLRALALRLEEQGYERLHSEGLIGPEVRRDLLASVSERLRPRCAAKAGHEHEHAGTDQARAAVFVPEGERRGRHSPADAAGLPPFRDSV